jgi:hypothetical protein
MAGRMSQSSLVLRGGKVASPSTFGGFAEAVAIENDLIVAVGTNEEVDALIGKSTRVVDLAGRLAIPAFGDAHVHAISGGLESLRQVNQGILPMTCPRAVSTSSEELGTMGNLHRSNWYTKFQAICGKVRHFHSVSLVGGPPGSRSRHLGIKRSLLIVAACRSRRACRLFSTETVLSRVGLVSWCCRSMRSEMRDSSGSRG